jgi:hypothetical protein
MLRKDPLTASKPAQKAKFKTDKKYELKRDETAHKRKRPDDVTVAEDVTLQQMIGRSVTVAASDATVATSGRSESSRESHEKHPISSASTPIDSKFCGMLLHENHSLSCLTTPEIEGSWFKTKKRTPKMKTAQSKCSSRFSSNPSVEIFLGSHSTLRNKWFAKRSTTERDRMMGRKGKIQEHEEQNANHKEHIIN